MKRETGGLPCGIVRVASEEQMWEVRVEPDSKFEGTCTLASFAGLREGDAIDAWQVRPRCFSTQSARHACDGEHAAQTILTVLASQFVLCTAKTSITASPCDCQDTPATAQSCGTLLTLRFVCNFDRSATKLCHAQTKVEAILPGVTGTRAGAPATAAPVEVDLLGSMGVGLATSDDGTFSHLKADEQTITELITGHRRLADLVQPADVKDAAVLLRKTGHGVLTTGAPVKVLLKRPWAHSLV